MDLEHRRELRFLGMGPVRPMMQVQCRMALSGPMALSYVPSPCPISYDPVLCPWLVLCCVPWPHPVSHGPALCPMAFRKWAAPL